MPSLVHKEQPIGAFVLSLQEIKCSCKHDDLLFTLGSLWLPDQIKQSRPFHLSTVNPSFKPWPPHHIQYPWKRTTKFSFTPRNTHSKLVNGLLLGTPELSGERRKSGTTHGPVTPTPSLDESQPYGGDWTWSGTISVPCFVLMWWEVNILWIFFPSSFSLAYCFHVSSRRFSSCSLFLVYAALVFGPPSILLLGIWMNECRLHSTRNRWYMRDWTTRRRRRRVRRLRGKWRQHSGMLWRPWCVFLRLLLLLFEGVILMHFEAVD